MDVPDRAPVERTTYDRFARPMHRLFKPESDTIAEFGEMVTYNARGHADTVYDERGAEGQKFGETVSMTARGQPLRTTIGAMLSGVRVQVDSEYDVRTGRLNGLVAAGGSLQRLNYGYDKLGNMTSRSDRTSGRDVAESFVYDVMQRLTTAMVTLSGTLSATTTFKYDNDGAGPGNLTFRSDLGAYTYGGTANGFCNQVGEVSAGPHAATSAAGVNYCYDRHGNQTRASDGRSIVYTAFDLPSRVTHTQSGRAIAWDYGANRGRLRRYDYASTSPSAVPNEVTHYVGGAEVVRDASGALLRLRRGSGPAIIVFERQAGATTRRTEYLLAAAQGSIYALLNPDASVIGGQIMSFDPFGQRRDANTGAPLTRAQQLAYSSASKDRRGYTGHDQADGVGLIHMNGRIYDPRLSRFVQADPLIQDPYTGQSFNRYTYVFNNPLSYTDPTGYWGKKEQMWLRTLASIAITIWLPGSPIMNGLGFTKTSIEAAVITGFVSGTVQSGTLKGGLYGALSAGLFHGIGTKFDRFKWAAKSLTHGVAGGVMSVLQGGRFGHGFASAGTAQALSPLVQWAPGGQEGRIIAAAVIGGTASELGGGKFANGAVTAAFARAFNEEMSEHDDDRMTLGTLLKQTVVGAIDGDGRSHGYETQVWACNDLVSATCTEVNLFENGLRYANAPSGVAMILLGGGTRSTPVTHGEKNYAWPLGWVRTYVEPTNYRLINVTTSDHTLAYGVVERAVVRQGHDLYISTIGRGSGVAPRLNESLSRVSWHGVDKAAIKHSGVNRSR